MDFRVDICNLIFYFSSFLFRLRQFLRATRSRVKILERWTDCNSQVICITKHTFYDIADNSFDIELYKFSESFYPNSYY